MQTKAPKLGSKSFRVKCGFGCTKFTPAISRNLLALASITRRTCACVMEEKVQHPDKIEFKRNIIPIEVEVLIS